MHTFADRITRVAVKSAALTRYLSTLPLAAWEHPSACARWDIGDVVAHLVDSGTFYRDAIVRGLQGECTPFANPYGQKTRTWLDRRSYDPAIVCPSS